MDLDVRLELEALDDAALFAQARELESLLEQLPEHEDALRFMAERRVAFITDILRIRA